jgi:LmbE family N-acetylglucosaminyl deacetylase
MWIAAHPDDECFSGSILAKASLRCSNPLHMLVLTHGEGGECCAAHKKDRPLAEVRAEEMREVARRYKASLTLERFFNAALPVESFPMRHELARRWLEQGDPADVVRIAICDFKPDVVLTFSPLFGATGHPEHQLTARFALAGIREAATTVSPDVPSHKVEHTYFVLNRYWGLRMLGMGNDPLEPSETFDVRQPCVEGRSCVQVMAENTRPHETQARDMGHLRFIARFLKVAYLKEVDPFRDRFHADEYWPVRGMG